MEGFGRSASWPLAHSLMHMPISLLLILPHRPMGRSESKHTFALLKILLLMLLQSCFLMSHLDDSNLSSRLLLVDAMSSLYDAHQEGTVQRSPTWRSDDTSLMRPFFLEFFDYVERLKLLPTHLLVVLSAVGPRVGECYKAPRTFRHALTALALVRPLTSTAYLLQTLYRPTIGQRSR
jgi:hypothetical protein